MFISCDKIKSPALTCVMLSFRVNQLLETGVLKQCPVWLDVVEAFPPDMFPKHNRTPEGGRPPVIVYPEDHLNLYHAPLLEPVNLIAVSLKVEDRLLVCECVLLCYTPAANRRD